jgi:hypothetical protein
LLASTSSRWAAGARGGPALAPATQTELELEVCHTRGGTAMSLGTPLATSALGRRRLANYSTLKVQFCLWISESCHSPFGQGSPFIHQD